MSTFYFDAIAKIDEALGLGPDEIAVARTLRQDEEARAIGRKLRLWQATRAAAIREMIWEHVRLRYADEPTFDATATFEGLAAKTSGDLLALYRQAFDVGGSDPESVFAYLERWTDIPKFMREDCKVEWSHT